MTQEVDSLSESLPGRIPSRPLIESRQLSVNFHQNEVLKDVDVSIKRGQTIAVIGESGCGKTVFMKSLVGLVKPTSGEVRFDGRNLQEIQFQELTETRRRFGFVFQNAALFDSMSVFDNVAFPLVQQAVAPNEEIEERVMRHLAEVGLPKEVARRQPTQLSGGMRKRVGLARALILRPEVVVYDEPTTGLDPIMSDVINELMLNEFFAIPNGIVGFANGEWGGGVLSDSGVILLVFGH